MATQTKADAGAEFFGAGFTWERLWTRGLWLMGRQFPWKNDDRLTEAVTEGWLYVRESWFNQPATQRLDPAFRWAYAVRTMMLRANDWLSDEDARGRVEIPISNLLPDNLTPEEEVEWVDNLFGPALAPSPLDVAIDHDLQDRAARVIEALREQPAEWDGWVEDLIEGLTLRDAGERRGVSKDTVARRRSAGLDRIRPLLAEHGLLDEEDI